MHDLTQGSIPKHIVRMAIPMAIGMVFQTLYYLVDLYFVGRLGDAALAGVSAAGNIQFIVMALTQVLGVGTMVLISHAAGRKDQVDGNLIFNQSLLLAAIAAVVVWVGGLLFADDYLRTLAADEATLRAGTEYLVWFLPALGLQFAIISIGSALRGTGIAKPTMVVQVLTVVLNAILAPILIAGWGTGRPMGVAGAALASTISVAFAVLLLLVYFIKLEHFVGFDAKLWRPHLPTWMRLLRIGVPAGGEFALIFVSMAINYYIVRDFGAAAQAGFGVGSRMMQAIFLPAMAVAFAAAPIAGQNFAAGKFDRARQTFFEAVKIGSVVMVAATLFAHWRPQWLISVFAQDPAVVDVAVQFLRTISWNFVATGIVFTCSGMFQAMGNTVPSVIASAFRLVIFAVPAFWISSRPGFQLHWLWYISVAATTVASFLTVWLLYREAEKKRTRGLAGGAPAAMPTDAAAEAAAG
jgi:putative MATE family efflux protein